MDYNSVRSIQISGQWHRIAGRLQVLPATVDPQNPPPTRFRFRLACGLTMDADPAWIVMPPERVDENGTPIPWTIAFDDADNTDCPACNGA